MKGYGLSDLGDGTGVQRFDVEIVGVLKSYAPKQDLILARIHGEALDEDGDHRRNERQPDLRRREADRRARLRMAVLARPDLRHHADPEHARHPQGAGRAAGADRRARRPAPRRFIGAFGTGEFAGALGGARSRRFRGEPAGRAASRRCRCPCRFSGRLAPGRLFERDGRSARAGSWRPRARRLRPRRATAPPSAPATARARLGRGRRAALGRHGPVGDRHRDLGRRQLDARLRPSVPVDGPRRHADGPRRRPDRAAVALPLLQVLVDRERCWARSRRTARPASSAASASRRRWCRSRSG